MPLYNNVIRNLDREDVKDEDKVGYEFWEGVENLPGIKQLGQYNEWSAKNQQALEERARSGESGKFFQALQIGQDKAGAVVGAPFQLIDTALDALSDRTNVDRRTLDAGIGTALTLAKVKGSKTASFNRGAKLKSNIKGVQRKVSNIGKPASQQVIDTEQIFNMRPTDYRRVTAIYRHHEGGITWQQAMAMAKLPSSSSSKHFYKDSEISVKKGGVLDPNRDDSTRLMYTSSGGPIVPDDNIQNARSIRPAFESHLTQGGRAMRLNYKALMNNKTFSQNYSRLVSGAWVTNWASGLPVSRGTTPSRQTSHNNLRQELLTGFEEDYGEAMERLEISRSDIDLDHKLTLIQSTGAYHNTARNSPLYNKIQEIALRRGYTPGDARANLELIDPESHRIKTRFFNDLHGLHTHNNMKYWNGLHRDTGKTRFKIMDESHKSPEGEALHLEVVEDYFDHVDRGTAILSDAQAVWKANNMTGILPEEISEELFKVVIDSDEAYTPSSLKATVESITESEIEKYKIVKKVLEIEKELENLNMLTSPETILPEDSAYVKELKQQLIKLKKVRKSTWFKNYLKELEIEYESGQTGLDLNDYQRVIEEELRPDRIDE